MKECLAIDQFMKHLTGGSKEQWPPVGKSSDTPKEVKNRKTGRITTGNREASEYGAGCIYMHRVIPAFYENMSAGRMSANHKGRERPSR